MLVALAALVAAVALARNHDAAEAALLVGLLATCALAIRLRLRDLRAHPANFPEPEPVAGAAHEETLMRSSGSASHHDRHDDRQVDSDREQILENRRQRPGAEGRVLAEALERGGQRHRHQGRDRTTREHRQRDRHRDL